MTKGVCFLASNLSKKPHQSNLRNLITAISYQQKPKLSDSHLRKVRAETDRNSDRRAMGTWQFGDYAASLECLRTKDCRGLSESPVPREDSTGVVLGLV